MSGNQVFITLLLTYINKITADGRRTERKKKREKKKKKEEKKKKEKKTVSF